MPKVGDKEFAYTAEGIEQAKGYADIMGVEIDYQGLDTMAPGGMYDAMERNVTEYAGGGKTGYAKIGMYKEGDLVKKTKGTKK